MKASLPWVLGFRAFFTPGARATSRFLLSSSLAMALGLVPLVVVLSIADGMIDGISARHIETLYYHVQAWDPNNESNPAATRMALQTSLAPVPGFRSLWPEQQGFALAYSPAAKLGLEVRGIDPRWPNEDPGAGKYLKAVQGTLTMDKPNDVWVGREAASKLGLKPGDTLRLLTYRTVGTLTVPRVTTVRMAAIISVGYQELDKLWLFAPLDLTLTLFDVRLDPVFWGIKGNLPLSKTKEFVAEVRHALGPDWQLRSWESTGRSLFLNYQATRALLAVVMSLILLVAAVNVSTAMVTTVGERRKETAILKALGASDRLIMGQFLVLGLVAGVVGTSAGLGAGVVVALGVNGLVSLVDGAMNLFTPGGAFHLLDSAYYLESIPVRFDLWSIAASGAGSVVLSVLASWWPARRAARERPLEVLRRA